MASIQSQIELEDRMSSQIYSIIGAMDSMITTMDSVDAAVSQGFDDGAIGGTQTAVEQMNGELEDTYYNLRKNVEQQESFNAAANSGTSIMQRLGALAAAVGLGLAL